MKKVQLIALVLLAFGVTALADMDDKTFGAGQTIAGSTNTYTLALRGELYGVYINVGTATTRTQTVTVASAQQTLFTKAVTADGWYPLQYPQYGSTGSALTFVGGTNNTANVVYDRAPLAGTITTTVVGGNGANVTNTTVVTVVYDRK